MVLGPLSYLVGGVCLAGNVAAIVMLVVGLARGESRRLWRPAALVVVTILAVCLGGWVWASDAAWAVLGDAEPAVRATALAQAIAEGMNMVAFVFVATPLPATAAIILGVKGRRRAVAEADAGA